MAHQAPLSMGFSRQDYWSGLPFPPPRDLPDPRIEPTSPVSPALAGRFFTTEPPGKPKSILKWKWKQPCPTPCDPMDYTVHGSSPGQNTGVVAFPFSRGIFPTQESNQGLPHCRWILYQLSSQGSPKSIRALELNPWTVEITSLGAYLNLVSLQLYLHIALHVLPNLGGSPLP